MGRKIEYIGEVIEISDYEEDHRYCNQKSIVEGIPVNPLMRSDFDSTPNNERDPREISEWWNKPFIQTCSWEDWDESWETYSKRMSSYSWQPEVETQEEFLERKCKQKENWFKAWPSGTRYEVRCLNGGAWDRALSLGMFATLEAAVAIASQYEPVNYSFTF